MNICAFVGNVASDPELKGNNNVLTFRLAVSSRVYNADSQQWEDSADFLDMVMYGKRAEAIGAWLKKGTMVTVQAHAHQNTWQDKNTKKSRIEFICDDLVAAPKK